MTLVPLIDTGAFLVTAVWVALSLIWPFVAFIASLLWLLLSASWWRKNEKLNACFASVVSVLPLIVGGSIVTGSYFMALGLLPSQWRLVTELLLLFLPYILALVAATLLILHRRITKQSGSNPALKFVPPSAPRDAQPAAGRPLASR